MAETIDGMRCPVCDVSLVRELCTGGSRPTCPQCAGQAVTVAMLRRFAPRERVNALWRRCAIDGRETERACPGCRQSMRAGTLRVENLVLEIDGCRVCQMLWFDVTELTTLSPDRQEPLPDEPDTHAESHARWVAQHRHDCLDDLSRRMAHSWGPGVPRAWAADAVIQALTLLP